MPLFLSSGSWKENIPYSLQADSWSGEVHFTEQRTGPGIIVYQHRKETVITNDTGTATHSLITEIKDKYKVNCNGQGKSYLEVGLEEDSSTNSIFASIPGCRGIRVSAVGNAENKGEDETGITVPD